MSQSPSETPAPNLPPSLPPQAAPHDGRTRYLPPTVDAGGPQTVEIRQPYAGPSHPPATSVTVPAPTAQPTMGWPVVTRPTTGQPAMGADRPVEPPSGPTPEAAPVDPASGTESSSGRAWIGWALAILVIIGAAALAYAVYGLAPLFIMTTVPLVVAEAGAVLVLLALLIAVGRVKRLNRLLDRAQARPGSGTQTPPAVRDALAGREALGRRYLGWAARGLVNNWDLVDASAEHLVGAWLLVPLVREADGAPRTPALPERITALADSRCVWQRRIAVLSTFAATRAGVDWPAHAVARRLLDDPHDLIHKAVGWMLRETGKRVDERALTAFLDRYAALMPRTMLRYAIEGLDPDARARYRAMRP